MAMDSSLGEIAADLAALKRIVDDVLASARLALDTSGPSSQPALPMLAERDDARALLEESAAKFRTAHPFARSSRLSATRCPPSTPTRC